MTSRITKLFYSAVSNYEHDPCTINTKQRTDTKQPADQTFNHLKQIIKATCEMGHLPCNKQTRRRRYHAIRYQSFNSWHLYGYLKPCGLFVLRYSLFCRCFVGKYQIFAVKSDYRGDRHKDRTRITARIACLKIR